jgi:hypothetical protein
LYYQWLNALRHAFLLVVRGSINRLPAADRLFFSCCLQEEQANWRRMD